MLLDIPEVLLVASLIVATKHNYPLDSIERFPSSTDDPLCHQMDWTAWESEFKKQPEKKPGILQYEHMDPQEIWSMRKGEMNELLNWFQETQIEKHPTGKSTFWHLLQIITNSPQTKPKLSVSSRLRTSHHRQRFPSCHKMSSRQE
jgi:RNA polymerase I-specific transcription initiation factor RRN7